jgi:hypothetical protein
MLIRVSGGAEGIEDYLEEGHKKGRDFARDELDERVILDGDLDTTREIISAVKGDSEKYLHITLAFKEDEISRETMDTITQEFKDFSFAAFDSDEYNFYAEAHLPRIKSYNHRQTGEFIERKPHIHIVIPEINLLSGHKLNPFGRGEHQIKFLDAFQERINEKYGLASPKDYRRAKFTGESEMISRYKGDIFTGHNKEMREQILNEMLSRNITSYGDFHTMLAEYGEVKIRNKGRDNEYLNIKPVGAEKGINLKDFVFGREFVELTPEGKRQRLAAEASRHYETAGPSRPSSAELEARLVDWVEYRAREIKYINSGNRKLYERYRMATPEEKQTILDEREARFYSKYRDTDHDRTINGRHVGHIRDNLRTADRHLEAARGAAGNLDAARGNLADRRNRRALERAFKALDAGRDRDQGTVGDARARRRSDSVTGQLTQDLDERRQQARSEDLSEWQEIKQRLDARRLLVRLSESHGVIPDKYEITKGRDGAARIRAGTRHLNVNDFLTKELNLPWAEASGILRETYAEQTGREFESRQRQQPRQQLWQEYQDDRKSQVARRAIQWEEQRQSESARRQAIKREWYGKRSTIRGNRRLKGIERKAALSVIRMERITQEQALRAAIQAERDTLKAEARRPLAEQYRDFLRKKAEIGNEHALAELRRMRRTDRFESEGKDSEPEGGAPGIDPGTPLPDESESAPLHAVPGLSYRVHSNGDVTYRRKGVDVLRDAGRTVRLFRTDDDNMETALHLARAKFGTRLELRGTADFKFKAARVAVERSLYVEFTDQRLSAFMAQRKTELEAGRTMGREARKEKGKGPQTVSVSSGDPARRPLVDPNTRSGRYTGLVTAVDDDFVYQEHGREVVRHARGRFSTVPLPGETLRIIYQDEQMTIQQDEAMARKRNRDGPVR